MRSFAVQIAAVFLFAFVADVIACVHIRTLVDDKILISAATILLLQILHHWPTAWFADEKRPRERWGLTLALGCGAALGTVVVIWWG